jgi:peptide chain release factor 1
MNNEFLIEEDAFNKLNLINDLFKKYLNNKNVFEKRFDQKGIVFFQKVNYLFNLFQEYLLSIKKLEKNKNFFLNEKDEEIKTLINEDIEKCKSLIKNIKEKISKDLVNFDQKKEEVNQNVIVEIRSDKGGDESCLFAEELFKMYESYCRKQNFNLTIFSQNFNEIGGLKNKIFHVKGKNAYEKLKQESGPHRVQRVPVTEKNNRVHTSFVTIAVFQEISEKKINIDKKDLKIDAFKSSGKGGQHVNTTDSAIRITHIPTGIVVSCQRERSQGDNKKLAMVILRTKIFNLFEEKRKAEIQKIRLKEIGGKEEIDKIRTYNFKQNRITDHRLKKSYNDLERILKENIEVIINDLIINEGKDKEEESLKKIINQLEFYLT